MGDGENFVAFDDLMSHIETEKGIMFQGQIQVLVSTTHLKTKSKSLYRKISIISLGLIFAQKAFLLGLFSGELIFRGAYYWKEFCISKWVGLDNNNTAKTT